LGVITQRTCRHYIGADADKASIPVAALTAGDIFIATDTKYWYQWTGAAWAWIVPDASIVEAKIGPLACAEAKIGNLSISAGKIKTNAVETAKIKDLNVTKGKAELGFGRYVTRAVTAADFNAASFTKDGAWHVDGLDVSAIVTAGAIAVHFAMEFISSAAGAAGTFRKDATDARNRMKEVTQVANIGASEGHAILFCNSDRLFDYNFPATTTAVEIVVLGWFI